MLHLGRMAMLAIAGGVAYCGPFAVPLGTRAEGRFDPVAAAEHEVAAWRALRAREESGVDLNLVFALREHSRHSWFRAAQAAHYFGRATTARIQDWKGITMVLTEPYRRRRPR